MKKRIIFLAVVMILGAGAWAAYSLLFEHGGPTNSLLVSGDIEAHESVLSFKTVQSRIVELPFDEGQWVNAGTLLARLEDHDYRQQVVVDEAALLVQQRQLALALRNLEAAKRTVASDQADLWEKTIDDQRDQQLWQSNVVSSQTRDLADTALKQSRAVLERDQALQAAAEESITVAQANIKNAQESLKLARIILGYTTLYAPFSGVILVRNAELGEDMQPGTPVFTLADLDHRPRSLRAGGADHDRQLSGAQVRRPDLDDLGKCRVHPKERRDPRRACDPGVQNQDRHREPEPRAQAGNAGGRHH
jgi:HlyD family secretion protein